MTARRERGSKADSARRPGSVQRRGGAGDRRGVRAGAPIEPFPDVSTADFGPHGGEVMASPRVFAIYWGRDYGAPATGMNARAQTLDRFFRMVVTSPYLDMLKQYGVGHGTFVGSTWMDYAPGVPRTLDNDQVRDVLIGWLDDGVAPEVPAWNERDLVFVLFPPADVTLTFPGQGAFCAYHWFGHYHNSPFQKANLFFCVVDTTSDTRIIGHELAEAFTDRDGDGWFSDVDGSEIADVCSRCGSAAPILEDFPVGSYWLVDQGRCLQQSDLAPVQPPATATVPRVIGMTPGNARAALQAAHFAVWETDVVDNTCEHVGVVRGQSPQGGTLSTIGATVTIWVGVRPPHPCP